MKSPPAPDGSLPDDSFEEELLSGDDTDPDCYETIMAALHDEDVQCEDENDLNATVGATSMFGDMSELDGTIQGGRAIETDADKFDATIESKGLNAKQNVGNPKPQSTMPERVGKFAIKRELGRGAFGVVYLGYDEELMRNVAIKVSLVSDPDRQDKLKTEASKAAQIESRGIVPVYHIGTTDQGLVFIVHKYIPGCSLRDVLKHGPIAPSRATALMRDLAIAMAPAHQLDILHRDLKPDNVLIDEKGNSWIADFGLAISESEQTAQRRELAGTPPYMSPEQIKGRVDFLDPRSDLWALGVMYYELLSGKLPFRGKCRASLTEQICERDPRPLQQYAPKILTDEINQVFFKACAKQPSDRYSTVIEFANALDGLLDTGLSEQNIVGQSSEDWFGDDDSDFLPVRSRVGSQASRGLYSRNSLASNEGKEGKFANPVETSSKNRWVLALALFSTALVACSIAAGWFYVRYFDNPQPALAAVSTAVPMIHDPSPGVDPDGSVESSSVDVAVIDDADDDNVARNVNAIHLDEVTESPTGGESVAEPAVVPVANSATDKPEPKPLPSVPKGVPKGVPRGVPKGVPKGTVPKGTEDDPMTVAIDGSGSHQTIVSAISDAPAGGFIELGAGSFSEALLIKKGITIVGPPHHPGQDIACSLRSDMDTVVRIDCGSDRVVMRGISVLGKGTKMTNEFNAVEVVSGTLVIQDVDLTTSSYNCVKVLSGGTFGARNCRFFESRKIAVSAKNHAAVHLVDCQFQGSGVELIGGSGIISGCEFFGARGVWCKQNDSAVRINDCKFDNGNSDSVAALEGGWIRISDSHFLRGDQAIQVFGGTVQVQSGCVINDYTVGAFISSGSLEMDSTEILESGGSAMQIAGSANVRMKKCQIDRASAFGIDMVSGKLNVVGGSIVGCRLGCINLDMTDAGDENEDGDSLDDKNLLQSTLADCTLSSPNVGVSIRHGELTLQNVRFDSGGKKGAAIGIYVDGSAIDQTQTPVSVRISDSVQFSESLKTSVFAKGRVMLDVPAKMQTVIQKTARLLPPAKYKDPISERRTESK